MKNSVKLGAALVLVAAGYCLAVDDSKLTFKLALGGDNQAAKWENPDDCSANLNPPFLPGSPADGQIFTTDSKITWEARVAVSGTHGGSAPTGVANLVFNLELRDSGGTVIDFPASDANGTVKGWYSSINKETTAPATKRHNPVGSGGCGVTAVDSRQLAAFAASFQVAAPNFNGYGRAIDQAAAGGPFMGYFLYPSGYGFPTGSTAASGKLLGMGAGYKKFLGSGCPFSNAGGEYCKYTTAEVTTPGIGTTTGCANGAWSDVPVFEGQMNLAGLPAGTYTLALVPGTGNNLLSGSIDCVALNNPGKFAFKPDQTTAGDTITFTLQAPANPAQVVGRYLFYSGSCYSSWGADPIATDKTAKVPGTGSATFANVSAYSRGLNGVIVDIQNPTDGANINASDFTFVYGNTTTPASWATALVPTSVTSALLSGTTYRVKIVFPSAGQPGAMPTRNWLKVNVKNNGPHIGTFNPAADDVFYFGLCIGECGLNNTASAIYVSSNDYNAAYANRTTFPTKVALNSVYDFNKDAQVTSNDYNLSYTERGDTITKKLVGINP